MKIECMDQDGRILLRPEGRLDSQSAGDLEEAVNAALSGAAGLPESLTIDMEAVDFISSKGLRVLVGTYKKLAGKEMILKNANSSVLEVLKLSGLMKIFTIR